ncbi:hypothetical protein C8R44DRAFT_846858 [Mycena epipterygia]|nr:hypothetical protein C8R44DRAFT_846858 [Mycena epipterygia]
MHRTFALFVAALAISCVSGAPLYARHKNHHKAAESAAVTAGIATGAIAVTTAPTPTAAASSDVNNIAAQVAAASASAASVQAAAIATGAPGEAFASPEFQGEEAGLETKLALDTQAGDTAAAAQDQADLDALNESAGGGI